MNVIDQNFHLVSCSDYAAQICVCGLSEILLYGHSNEANLQHFPLVLLIIMLYKVVLTTLGRGGGDSHIKVTGVLVVPLRRQNLYVGTA